jgi:hypothetical protein
MQRRSLTPKLYQNRWRPGSPDPAAWGVHDALTDPPNHLGSILTFGPLSLVLFTKNATVTQPGCQTHRRFIIDGDGGVNKT